VFEPNTTVTRSRFVNTITPIFELAKNTEGLYDYLIVCDDRNNTSTTIDNNELIVDIYIKPVRTAEFILINFIATRTSQNFAELV
jgi:phage tail sheath protein FI